MKNSRNRSQKKSTHLSGSKPFSQCSYEKVITGEAHLQAFLLHDLLIFLFLTYQRDSKTGNEPNDLELWYITHTKNGEWKDQVSEDIYVSS